MFHASCFMFQLVTVGKSGVAAAAMLCLQHVEQVGGHTIGRVAPSCPVTGSQLLGLAQRKLVVFEKPIRV